MLIILSDVTRPRTFSPEFHAIAAQLRVHRPCFSSQEIEKNPLGLVKSDHSFLRLRRCLLLPFLRPSSSSYRASLAVSSWSCPPANVIPSPVAVHACTNLHRPLFVNVTAFLRRFSLSLRAPSPSPLLFFGWCLGLVCGDFSSRRNPLLSASRLFRTGPDGPKRREIYEWLSQGTFYLACFALKGWRVWEKSWETRAWKSLERQICESC